MTVKADMMEIAGIIAATEYRNCVIVWSDEEGGTSMAYAGNAAECLGLSECLAMTMEDIVSKAVDGEE